MKSLWIGRFKTWGKAIQAANQLSHAGHEVLEVSPLGPKGQILVTLESDPPSNLEVEKSCLIREPFEEILRSYLSLKNSPANKNLVFLNFEFLGDAFLAAQRATSLGAQLVDLRQLRGSQPSTHLVVTFPNGLNPEVTQFLVAQRGHASVDVVENLHVSLSDLFS